MRTNLTYDSDNHPITEVFEACSLSDALRGSISAKVKYSRLPGHWHPEQCERILEQLRERAARVQYVQH